MAENIKKYYRFGFLEPKDDPREEMRDAFKMAEGMVRKLFERVEDQSVRLVAGPTFLWCSAPKHSMDWSKEAAEEFHTQFPENYTETEEWKQDPWFPQWKLHRLYMRWTEASNGVERPL